MKRLRIALSAVWGFVVGDDWRTAAGVAIALGLTAIVAALGVSAWWVMPVAVVLLLWRSLAGALPGTGSSSHR